MRKAAIVLASLAVVGLFLYFSGFTEAFMTGFDGHPGLPSCASSHGQSDVKRAIENGPNAKMTGLAVIGMTDVKTISANAEKVECTATAILNSAQQGLMNYSFTSAPSLGTGQYFIHAKVEPDSIKPYP
jgi:hypothetical protein